MDVVVVGGGVFGLFVAYYLVNEGVDVTIVDFDEPGHWSRAAAGLIEYRSFSINYLGAPGYVVRYLGMVRSGDALIRHVSIDWLIKYLKGYGRSIPSEFIDGIREINDYSRSVYRGLAEEVNDFEYSEEPYYEIPSNIEDAVNEVKRDPLNPRFKVTEFMGREAVAIYDVAELSTDLLIDRLLKEVSGRVRIIKALTFGLDGNRVLLSNGRVISGDAVIVTAGYWSSTLGIPVMPFKGFGFRVRAGAKLSNAVSFDDLGLFIIPFKGWFKVTSRFDPDSSIETKPAMEILRRIKSVLGDVDVIDLAIGYRPCTPDGLPIIDRISGNVYVATGGCRLGWTQAPGAAKLIVDLALGRIKETKFKLSRFVGKALD